MDDHRQPEFRVRASGDCAAAERAKIGHPESEGVPSGGAWPSTQRPFVWQSGRNLLLLEWELGTWVLAELEFDPRDCRYTELRRSFYRWEREAVGALLSRTVAYGDDAAVEAADLLDTWICHRR